jgi:ER membrane protein complex subunit 1
MRLYALLILTLCHISSVFAVLADEAYHVDWHQALLGIPQSESTFFHRPSASLSASLLYTISDRGVLGAVNPKDGSLVWRQPLAELDTRPEWAVQELVKLPEEEQVKELRESLPAKGGLLARDGKGFVVSYYGPKVSAWDATSGKLIWQRVMPNEQHVRSASLVLRKQEVDSPEVVDVVVSYGVEGGTILKLDGGSGDVLWEHAGSR